MQIGIILFNGNVLIVLVATIWTLLHKFSEIKSGGRQKVMWVATSKFARRFLIYVLLGGFRRIRHYGLLSSSTRKASITQILALQCLRRLQQVKARSYH
ncbi:transposase [Salipiger sp. 1_MG-2023]|uniref:transposase n=1 Tax=Salipiger sp. 1_MG-2023 TaxID=3062665 RepID=UPI0026E16391|nr:transposase [Salipiger sp. 1_MG-2023]MDO6586547.1 transposase [Salipiger sp. 1_MG-2023]